MFTLTIKDQTSGFEGEGKCSLLWSRLRPQVLRVRISVRFYDQGSDLRF